MQDLYVDTPLLVRNVATGKWKLTIRLEKSPNLQGFQPFPFIPEGTAITPDGRLEFEFTAPGPQTFFRLHAR